MRDERGGGALARFMQQICRAARQHRRDRHGLIGQIHHQREHAAVAHTPAGKGAGMAQCHRIERAGAGQARDDLCVAQRQQAVQHQQEKKNLNFQFFSLQQAIKKLT